MNALLPWILFNAFVLFMLALDLGVFHRTAHRVSFKEALTWSGGVGRARPDLQRMGLL